ncbi:MAG: hypothetical protein JSW27_00855 [Phycisphaerales bacterium]|nr:MAG: hypothetical protein JSW27_00855 [Phycisphaerales bacterium]
MGKGITVYAGIAGVLLGLLVTLAGCATGGEEAAAPATRPADEVAAVETASAPEPQVSYEPAPDEVESQVEPAPEPPAVAGSAEQAVALTLKYVPGQTTTYRVTTETERSIAWEGDTTNKPAAFRDGHTGQRIEITFDQTVAQVSSAGNASLEVTIKTLRFLGRARDKVVLDFDSSRAADQQHPLANLIGQRYRMEVTPRGAVLTLLDLDAARQAAQGNVTASRLLSDKAIEHRHEVPALMALDTTAVEPGGQWNSIRAISFGILGSKAYDRIYTLQAVEGSGSQQTAIVDMEAIPPVTGPGQTLPEQAANPFAAMSDSTDSYTGLLKLDLSTGQIERYIEQFRAEWVTADPASIQSGQAHPAVLRMGMRESYQLERVE